MSFSKKGFSLIEILVASSLALGLGLAVSAALSSASKVAKVSLASASSEQQIRDVMQVSTRYIKSARPRGACLSTGLNPIPIYTTPFNVCPAPQITQDGNGAVISAQYNKIEFYTYWRDCDVIVCSPTEALNAPSKLTIEVVDILATPLTSCPGKMLKVSVVYPTATSTYTTANFSGQPVTPLREVVLIKPSMRTPMLDGSCLNYPSALNPFFKYYNSQGAPASDTGSISVVSLNPKIWVQLDVDSWKEYGYPSYVPILYKGFDS